MKRLIIAEKPSLGKTIASAIGAKGKKGGKERGTGWIEGKDYIITWAFGHIFALKDVDDYIGKKTSWKKVPLPYIPSPFKFKPKQNKGALEQIKIIKELASRKDVGEIVNCGDADREGQIIIDTILRELKIKKPILRLWLPEQTNETIKSELKNLKENKNYHNLASEGYARTCMDWLMGINLTRYLTLKTGKLMPVGRVIIPILKFIYDREESINNFVPEKYFTCESEQEKGGTKFKLSLKKKFKEKEKAKEKCESLNSLEAVVVKKDKKSIKKQAKKLFSLSTLQSELSKKNKIPFKDSLEVIQKLYENGYITYPRTNTEYLAENEKGKVKSVLEKLSKDHNVKFKNSKKIFDDSKIESHSAITPTTKFPTLNALTDREKKIYLTIRNRFISNFLNEETVTEKVILEIEVGKDKFKLVGETIVKEGFFKYEPQKIDSLLPNLKVGENFSVNFNLQEKETKPPKRVSERELATYLKNPFRKETDTEEEEYRAIMSGVEIGTEATRTGIVENAKKYEYIRQEKSSFYLEPFGKTVIEVLNKLNINLYSKKTVEFSKDLKRVYHLELTVKDVVSRIREELVEIVKQDIKIEKLESSYSKEWKGKQPEKEKIATCPRCGMDIYEGEKAFYCSSYFTEKKCGYTLWRNQKILPRKLSKTNAKKLISGERLLFDKLKSKAGKEYSAYIKLEDTGKYVNLKLDGFLENSENKKTSLGKCPRCGKNIYGNSKSYYCESYSSKEKCGFTLWKENKKLNYLIDEKTVRELLLGKSIKIEKKSYKLVDDKKHATLVEQ